MPDRDHAAMMLAMAGKDFQALKAMLDEQSFAEEIFGFHAQQAVEKTLKAWLSCKDIIYPKIHDLEEIAGMLADGGEPFPLKFIPLLELTDFAVLFRYEAYDFYEEKLDRPGVIKQISELLDYVAAFVTQIGN
jgi:HEPN domain-containing protein